MPRHDPDEDTPPGLAEERATFTHAVRYGAHMKFRSPNGHILVCRHRRQGDDPMLIGLFHARENRTVLLSPRLQAIDPA